LQWERAIALIEGRSARWWMGAGAVGAVVPLLLTALTPLAVDVGLVALSVASVGGAWSAVRLKARLAELPLEIAPVVGTGIVDGVRVYRFRVRLGRGRSVLLPFATVSFVDEEDERYALRAELPGDDLCGPFVIVVPDPEHRCLGEGRFEVHVVCESEGRRWEAERVLPRTVVQDGWFGGIDVSSGTLRFEPDWTRLVTGSPPRP
jgi:hypothetical protein